MTVVGVGNVLRGDDAAGLAVVRAVRARRPDVRVLEWTSDLLLMFDEIAPESSAILVDAVVTGSAPGTVLRWDAANSVLPAAAVRTSTHAFSLAAAVEMARALGKLPQRVTLFGIEGANFDEGGEMSPPVAAALPALVGRILAEVDQDA